MSAYYISRFSLKPNVFSHLVAYLYYVCLPFPALEIISNGLWRLSTSRTGRPRKDEAGHNDLDVNSNVGKEKRGAVKMAEASLW